MSSPLAESTPNVQPSAPPESPSPPERSDQLEDFGKSVEPMQLHGAADVPGQPEAFYDAMEQPAKLTRSHSKMDPPPEYEPAEPPPPAEPTQPPSQPTEEELREALQAQREASEQVADMQQSLERIRVTCGARISDLHSPHFQNSSPTNKCEQAQLVRASKIAADAYGKHKMLEPGEAAALTDELLVALGSDLQLSEQNEVFWGITVPDFEMQLDSGPAEWHTHASGLLVYRTWQLLTRTSAGRKALVDTYLETARMTEDAPEVDYESYSLIHGILARALQAGKIVEFFTACVKALPTSKTGTDHTGRPCITLLEQSSVLSAVANCELDWVKVRAPPSPPITSS